MFTPKNIQGALEELYDLCDPDYMVDMLVNYSEEFDDISPALLAKSFQKNAEMISEYRVLSSAGEGIDYQGKVLLNSRAVRLLSYVEDMSGDEKVRTIQSKELWLAEDMTFYVVSCMSTITMDKEEAIWDRIRVLRMLRSTKRVSVILKSSPRSMAWTLP